MLVLLLKEQLTNKNVSMSVVPNVVRNFGYDKEREKEEYEEYTSVSSFVSTTTLV